MLHSVILFLSLSISPVSAPATGANVAHVFAGCEWHADSTTGVSVEVCDGRAVAWKDGLGNYDVARYSRR